LRAAGQSIRQQKGRCEGRKPFGTREGESTAIDRIQELRSLGKNYTQIAQLMNEEKHSTRNGGQWYVGSVSRVLNRAGAQ